MRGEQMEEKSPGRRRHRRRRYSLPPAQQQTSQQSLQQQAPQEMTRQLLQRQGATAIEAFAKHGGFLRELLERHSSLAIVIAFLASGGAFIYLGGVVACSIVFFSTLAALLTLALTWMKIQKGGEH
jgi:hypothetical protein